MTNPQKVKGDKRRRTGPPCRCGCGGQTYQAGYEYIRGHRPPPSLADVFWRHVDKTGECWVWTAHMRSAGYGQVGIPGTHRVIDAHRASWLIEHGRIPVGAVVCHHCDNRLCVRPDHLFIGTQRMNNRDAMAKGRIRASRARGLASGNAKLTDAQVAEIRSRYQPGIHPARKTGGSVSELAREFGITPQYVWQLSTNQWRVDA